MPECLYRGCGVRIPESDQVIGARCGDVRVIIADGGYIHRTRMHERSGERLSGISRVHHCCSVDAAHRDASRIAIETSGKDLCAVDFQVYALPSWMDFARNAPQPGAFVTTGQYSRSVRTERHRRDAATVLVCRTQGCALS